ncbi:unnamed protein product [Adineta ricciae]|uniref:Uncharacterized protein n=1 Tax=Adineta ricciae TaxID=249248 RepID=A0A813PGP2_ADIRI|nr:unnamed protein product [Adineta ricciae]
MRNKDEEKKKIRTSPHIPIVVFHRHHYDLIFPSSSHYCIVSSNYPCLYGQTICTIERFGCVCNTKLWFK